MCRRRLVLVLVLGWLLLRMIVFVRLVFVSVLCSLIIMRAVVNVFCVVRVLVGRIGRRCVLLLVRWSLRILIRLRLWLGRLRVILLVCLVRLWCGWRRVLRVILGMSLSIMLLISACRLMIS